MTWAATAFPPTRLIRRRGIKIKSTPLGDYGAFWERDARRASDLGGHRIPATRLIRRRGISIKPTPLGE